MPGAAVVYTDWSAVFEKSCAGEVVRSAIVLY